MLASKQETDITSGMLMLPKTELSTEHEGVDFFFHFVCLDMYLGP